MTTNSPHTARSTHPTRVAPVRDIAVVGAGAAGTLTAMRLLQHAAADPGPTRRVWLIDPAPTGRGLAFSTTEPHHLLNVPATNMSAHVDQPGHFVQWLGEHGHGDGFVPRGLYGRYLADSLDEAVRRRGAPELVRLHERVVSISHSPAGGDGDRGGSVELRFATGQVLAAHAVVLALGNFPPDTGWAPTTLRAAPGFFPDPWMPGLSAAIGDTGDVLLVGTGLTMVDIAHTLRRPGRVVHAVSRHGLLPQRHGEPLLPPADPPHLDGCAGLAELRRAVLCHLSRCRRTHGDWRPGVDSLRPLTTALWQRLAPDEQAAFLREDLRHWETHRHRIPPSSAEALRSAVESGQVTVGSGTVTGAEVGPDGIRVVLDDGRALTVTAVVNCTGSQTDLTRVADPFVTDLLGSGLALPAPLGGGLQTDPTGRLLPAAGRTQAPLWTLGGLRRGGLLETTAIPEIRHQADSLARELLTHTGVATAPAPQLLDATASNGTR
ncbi:FAD/NAD(P)-binding protein [Streptacidiphilus anmyonensis]|uniref:FAD/NAD(P)-binding protein n=1 Tax=Streptacidiphilus anmyonensis TaxID=405782 RepID=UPI0007C7C79B|nr:FAD/NAD(P)-binding protein [Streptacidiphilus anmyonensis]